MRSFGKRYPAGFLYVLLLVLFLTACSAGGDNQRQKSEITTLTYAVLNMQNIDREAVSDFNRSHKDVQIELKEYYTDDTSGKSAMDRLVVDIISGNCPDIFDMGNPIISTNQLPYRQLAEKGYLEDLWPYIDNDPELGRDSVMEAPLKAAEVNGGLYVLFSSVMIDTLIGAERIVGDRISWSLEDLREAFAAMPEGSTILEDFYTKSTTFYYLLGMDLNSYVDWETGQCSFDNDRFRSALEFINSFPQEFDWSSVDSYEMNMEWNTRLHNGLQMLSWAQIMTAQDIQVYDALLGERASLIGYPVEDGSPGSCFVPSITRLGMSSTCRDKDAAWKFIRQLLLSQETLPDDRIPINRKDFNRWCHKVDTSGTYSTPGFRVDLHQATEEEIDRFLNLYNNITRIDLFDTYIYEVTLEVCGPYFAGDKTLDETVDLVQRRVSLYVNESR